MTRTDIDRRNARVVLESKKRKEINNLAALAYFDNDVQYYHYRSDKLINRYKNKKPD